MTYIENIFLCMVSPLLVAALCMGRRQLRFFLFCIAGMGVCLLSAYINTFLAMFSYRELPCRSFRFTPRSHSAPTDVNPNFDRVCKHCECTHSCGFHQPNTKSRHFA